MKKTLRNKKGFTLAELLVVVAIIAVLVAIAIPIFTTQLEKAREAVDLANIRAAYAECASEVLTNDQVETGYCKKVEITQKENGWKSTPEKIAGTLDVKTDTIGNALGGTNKTVYVCVSNTGALSLSTSITGTEIK